MCKNQFIMLFYISEHTRGHDEGLTVNKYKTFEFVHKIKGRVLHAFILFIMHCNSTKYVHKTSIIAVYICKCCFVCYVICKI